MKRRKEMKKEGNIVRAALYARCSTHDKGQDPEHQLAPLREYSHRRGFTIVGEYVDNGVSGIKDRRPQLDKFLEVARKCEIDCIIVWKLDRFGRSLKQLVTVLVELSSLGIGFNFRTISTSQQLRGGLCFTLSGLKNLLLHDRDEATARALAALDGHIGL